MRSDLAEFLRRELSNGREYHCSTLPADWCLSLGYPDFALKWRDVFDPDLCEALPAQAGGLVALWDEGIGSGLPEALGEFVSGDIAVIAAHGLEAGALFTGQRWALRARRGLHFLDAGHASVVKAWRP